MLNTMYSVFVLLFLSSVFFSPIIQAQNRNLEGVYLCTCGPNQEIPFISPLRDCSLAFGTDPWIQALRKPTRDPTIGGAFQFGLSVFKVVECINPMRVVTEAELKMDVLLEQVMILEKKIIELEKK